MGENSLRKLLREGKPTLGTHLLNSWPMIIELIGRTGAFDYIEFNTCYAPYDLYALEKFGRTLKLFPEMSGMLKVEQEPRTYLAGRTIAAGIQNLLFADIRSVEDAKESVRSVRPETPGSDGIHGVGMWRDICCVSQMGTEAFVKSLQDAVVGLMIEKKEAVENLEEILSVEGVDMVQFGPGDYAMSIGLAGQWDHPQVKEAELYVIETAIKKGIPPRVEVDDPKDAEEYLDMGVRHFCIGYDLDILFKWFSENGKIMRELLSKV
jgi:2-keto-3-deoxy-L-rhamnonate aldolase RhmA